MESGNEAGGPRRRKFIWRSEPPPPPFSRSRSSDPDRENENEYEYEYDSTEPGGSAPRFAIASAGFRPFSSELSMSAAQSRKPWPMKWIVLAIVAFIIPYTYLELHFRKPGPAYRPYEDTRNRINNARLLSAGFQRVTLNAERPAEPGRLGLASAAPAVSAAAPGGLPAELGGALIDQPLLPVSIDSVTTAATVASAQAYAIQFTCTLPDNKEQLADAHLYHREGVLFLVPSFEKLDGGLLARTRESTVLVTVPAATLRPGSYTVTVIGGRASRRWTLQVH